MADMSSGGAKTKVFMDVWNAALDGKLICAADPLVEGGTLLVFAPLPSG
jgi:hypothetical protein